jgi:internalin A
MKKFFTLLLASALLLQVLSISTVSAQDSSIKTFAQWCQQRDSLPNNTKHTIDVMLKKSSTKDCQQAEHYLDRLTELNLSANKDADIIVDVRPLASLNNLNKIDIIFSVLG